MKLNYCMSTWDATLKRRRQPARCGLLPRDEIPPLTSSRSSWRESAPSVDRGKTFRHLPSRPGSSAMIRLLSVVGARPNFMKIAPIISEFNKFGDVEHCLVHTGQHYDQ